MKHKVKTLINNNRPSSDAVKRLFDDVELPLDIELVVMDNQTLFANLHAAYDTITEFVVEADLEPKAKEIIIKNLIYCLSNINPNLSMNGDINNRVQIVLEILEKLGNTKYSIEQLNYLGANIDNFADVTVQLVFSEYVKLTQRNKIAFDNNDAKAFLTNNLAHKLALLSALDEAQVKLNQDELKFINSQFDHFVLKKQGLNHDDISAISKSIQRMKKNNILLKNFGLDILLENSNIVAVQDILQALDQPKLTEKRFIAFAKHVNNITAENKDDIIECINLMRANGIPLSDENENLETLLKQENITKISNIRMILSTIKPLSKSQFQIIKTNINCFINTEEALTKLVESQRASIVAFTALQAAFDNNQDTTAPQTEYDRRKQLYDEAKTKAQFQDKLIECIKLIQDAKLSLSTDHLNVLLKNARHIEGINEICKAMKPLSQSRFNLLIKHINVLPSDENRKYLIESIGILQKNGLHLTGRENLFRLMDVWDNENLAKILRKMQDNLSQSRLDVILKNRLFVHSQTADCIDKLGNKIRLTDINKNLERIMELTENEMVEFNELLKSFPAESNSLTQKRLDVILKNANRLSLGRADMLNKCLKEINGLKLALTGNNHLLDHLMISSDASLDQIGRLFQTLKSKMSVTSLAPVFADNIANLSVNDGSKCKLITEIVNLAVSNNVEFKNGSILGFFDNESINVKELLQLDENELRRLHENLQRELPKVTIVADKTKKFKSEMDKLDSSVENEMLVTL